MSGTESLSTEAIHEKIYAMGKRARAAGHALANLAADQKNTILRAMAAELRSQVTGILFENAKDLEAGRENGLSSALLDRLRLNESRLEAMADGIEQVAQLSDPVGDVLDERERPNGMKIGDRNSKFRLHLGSVARWYLFVFVSVRPFGANNRNLSLL